MATNVEAFSDQSQITEITVAVVRSRGPRMTERPQLLASGIVYGLASYTRRYTKCQQAVESLMILRIHH
jgi:hypothetical protein